MNKAGNICFGLDLGTGSAEDCPVMTSTLIIPRRVG
jgi:hypothetical protein